MDTDGHLHFSVTHTYSLDKRQSGLVDYLTITLVNYQLVFPIAGVLGLNSHNTINSSGTFCDSLF